MSDQIIVRFTEHNRYDINTDSERTTMMATLSYGTFWADVPSLGPVALRRYRQDFKEEVIECIRSGMNPHEIKLSEEGEAIGT